MRMRDLLSLNACQENCACAAADGKKKIKAGVYNDAITEGVNKEPKQRNEAEAIEKAKQIPSGNGRGVGLAAGGPGSGRHPGSRLERNTQQERFKIGHTFRGLNAPTIAKNTLMKLGYSQTGSKRGTGGKIERFKHPTGASANVVHNFRVHMNAPLEHHNTMRLAFDRTPYDKSRAEDVAKRRSWS